MKDILKTLVEIPSTSGDHKANFEIIDYIDRFLSEHAMYVKRFNFNGVESLVATTQKTKKPKLLLSAHADVITGPANMFKFREENDRYIGRGVFDMKCAIAAYLQLIRDLNGHLHEYDLGLMVTTDEEMSGENGTRALVEEESYGADVVVMPDAGDSPDGWKLERSAKGMLRILIKVSGKNAHGSRPWQGDNAIDKLIALIGEIRALFKDQRPGANSLTVSIINGGKPDNDNMVPDYADVSMDIRTLTDADADHLLAQINQISSRFDAEVTVKVFGNAHRTDKTHPKIASFIDCWKQIVPNSKLTEADNTGNSDARFFAKAGVPCIVISSPGDGYHMDHEWVSKEGLDDLLKVLHLYTERTAKIPPRKD